jgi:transcription initiation factor TFIIB
MGQALEKQMSAGKDPMGLAATVVYASSIKTGESITQIDMAKAAGVTEVTIRNRFKDNKKFRVELIGHIFQLAVCLKLLID